MSDRRELLDDPEESQRMAQDGMQARIWTALPGIIESVDLEAQTVSVQPTIKGVINQENGSTKTVNMPLLVDVPIVFPRAGGFSVTFPVAQGDECLVVFASRCIDAWYQSGGIQEALEARMHDLSDGFAILGPTSQPKRLENVQTDGLELRTEDRSTYIKLTPGTIYIHGDIIHTGTTTQTGDVNINGSTTQTGDVTHTGNTNQTGTLTSTTVSAGSMTAGGISLAGHVHGGVQTGTNTTGGPQ